jgi:ligand-binding SRPBCC domain-containing protein
MPTIELETRIDASIAMVFDLSRSIDLHVESTARSKEKAVAGRTGGLIGLGEQVTWEATHFGVRQQLKTEITQYDRPRHFRDSMVTGAFQRFDHDHHFASDGGQTRMKDIFDYTSPLGFLGQIADMLFLNRHMTRLLQTRNDLIKSVAESDRGEIFLKEQLKIG